VLICCANQKGGVGKTTTAVNLAVCLSRQAAGRMLAVDCDPQATMTRQLGIDVRTTALTLVDVLAGRAAAANAILSDVVAGVDVIAGARELSGVEMALVGELGREHFLSDALEPLRDIYATIVLDTPPNLGLLTVNALIWPTSSWRRLAARTRPRSRGSSSCEAPCRGSAGSATSRQCPHPVGADAGAQPGGRAGARRP